jgi:predicted MFS family arabinose efflux permease
MLMPYLAQHLGEGLGMSGWTIGLILGLRVFSQQGLFLLGGWLGDRLGYRRAIVCGCVLRCVGFALLGWAHGLPMLLVAVVLTGFAGALFSPCAQACLATQCPAPELRRSAFALHNMASEAGMLVGPMIGMALTRVEFGLTGSAAAVLFLLFAWLQWRHLPPDEVGAAQSVRRSISWADAWHGLMRERALWRFAAWCSVYQVLFHQLYLVIPAFVRQHGLGAGALGSVFTLSAVLGIAAQWPVSRWIVPRMGEAAAMGQGLALMGLAFLAPLIWDGQPMVAMMTLATLLSLGSVLCFPLFATQLPQFAGELPLGTCYGLVASVGGCAALLGQLAVGASLGQEGASPATAVWMILAALGVVGGAGLWRMRTAR